MELIAAIALPILVWTRFRSPRPKGVPDTFIQAFFLWVAGAGLYLIARQGVDGPNLHYFFERILYVAALLVVYLVAVETSDDQSFRSRLSGLSALSAGLLAAVGIAQFAGFPLFPDLQLFGRLRMYSLVGNPNYLAGSLAALLLFSLYWFLQGGTVRRLTGGVAIILALVCLLLTRSRGGWLACICGVIIFVGILVKNSYFPSYPDRSGRRRRMIKKLALAAAAMVAGLIITVSFWNDRLDLGERVKSALDPDNPNIRKRLLMWKVSWKIVGDHPVFGVGLGTLGDRYLDYQRRYFLEGNEDDRKYSASPNHIHNDYLELAAETGVPGVILFLSFLAAVFWRGLSSLPGNGENNRTDPLVSRLRFEDETLWRASLSASAAACLVDGLVGFPLSLPVSGVVLFGSLGLLAGKRLSPVTECRTSGFTLGWIPAAITGVVLPVLLLIMLFRLAASDIHISSAIGLVKTGHGEAAVKHLTAAANYNPWNPLIPYYQAQAAVLSGDTDRALSLYGESLNRKAGYMAHYNRGSIYSAMKLYSQARDEYNRALELYPRLGEAAFSLGLVADILGSSEEAEQAWIRADRDSRQPIIEARYQLAKLAVKKGDRARAAEHFISFITVGNQEITRIQREVTAIMGGPPSTAFKTFTKFPDKALKLLRRQNTIARDMAKAAQFLKSEKIDPPPFFTLPKVVPQ